MSILTIQSHVAYGHVGNSAAVFPLQRLGYEVWPVHSVLFSNHAGYPSFAGKVMPAREVADVIQGIEQRGVFPQCQAVLSGYLGAVDLGQIVLSTVDKVKAANKSALYCCDPVMGDRGKDIYVDVDIPDFMRKYIVPKADILIPNHFELEVLIGSPLSELSDIISAARDLLTIGPQIIVVTSAEIPGQDPNTLSMLAVSADKVLQVTTPRLAFTTTPSGAGDVSAALFLAHYLRSLDLGSRDPDSALAKMAAGIFGLLQHTIDCEDKEIALVAAQDEFVNPTSQFEVIPLAD